jgi:hypothetical protein
MAEVLKLDRQRESKRRHEASVSARTRDMGLPLAIVNVRRRARCRNDLAAFCRTYNPAAFYLPWSEIHLGAIARIEEAAKHGALYVYAMARGSGKSTLARMAALWAISYAWCRFVFVVGANAGKAEQAIDAVKTVIRFGSEYGEDFPEIAQSPRHLAGIANRAAGQVCDGAPTMVAWGKGQVILPTVPPPPNWPRGWPLRDDGMAPTSGSVVSASGLTGDGIRGSVITLTSGEFLRPDLVLLDDPSTPESARSPAQNAEREQLVSADLLGMAGPDRAISAVMPVTVIAANDLADNMLDNSRHPLWRGERSGILKSMPVDLAAWEPYFTLYARCTQKRPPDFAEANAYYQAHREQLEAGAEASWAERKLPTEVSAIQSAMHLYFRDKRAFWSEYMNQPFSLTPPVAGELQADQVAARLNRCPRGVAPAGTTRLTAFVDVQKDLLWWLICGWTEQFGGGVVDYGAYPDQNRPYFTLTDARPTLTAATGIGSLEGSLYEGLTRLAAQILGREWAVEGGGSLRVERCLVDSGWGLSTELVHRWVRQSPWASVLLASKGVGVSSAMVPLGDWPRQQGERRGDGWTIRIPASRMGRVALYDANLWKSRLAAKLRQPLGEPGALALFGADAAAHRMISDHFCSEYQIKTTGRGREVEEWKQRANRPDNHLWDAATGCAVAASILGLTPGGIPAAREPKKRPPTLQELQARARGMR